MKTLEKIFSEDLKKFRGSRTQEEIAAKAGIPPRSYQLQSKGFRLSLCQGEKRQRFYKSIHGRLFRRLWLASHKLNNGKRELIHSHLKFHELLKGLGACKKHPAIRVI